MMNTNGNHERLRARLEALLEQWGAEFGAALNLVCIQGRRLTYVAGPTRCLPCVPAQRIPVAAKVALMAYGESPLDEKTCKRLEVKATQAGAASAALELAERETEAKTAKK